MHIIAYTLILSLGTVAAMQAPHHDTAIIDHAVRSYLAALPCIKPLPQDAPPEIKAQHIVQLMQQFYPTGYSIAPEQESLECTLLVAKVNKLIKEQLPLSMHMPGLPFK